MSERWRIVEAMARAVRAINWNEVPDGPDDFEVASSISLDAALPLVLQPAQMFFSSDSWGAGMRQAVHDDYTARRKELSA